MPRVVSFKLTQLKGIIYNSYPLVTKSRFLWPNSGSGKENCVTRKGRHCPYWNLEAIRGLDPAQETQTKLMAPSCKEDMH